MGCKIGKQHLKPKLSQKHKLNRMDWVCNEIEDSEANELKFVKNFNTVHVDEAWYYLRTDGTKVRMLKNPDGTWQMFDSITAASKRFIAKVMFLGAFAH